MLKNPAVAIYMVGSTVRGALTYLYYFLQLSHGYFVLTSTFVQPKQSKANLILKCKIKSDVQAVAKLLVIMIMLQLWGLLMNGTPLASNCSILWCSSMSSSCIVCCSPYCSKM